MTELLSDLETPSDAELISRVRGGEVAAYGDLFARHVEAANRLARQLVRGPDSDDLVSEAFAKVLHVLQGGGGPDVAFRAYLLTAVRRLHVDRVRAASRVQTTGDMTTFDPGVPFQDPAVAGFESGAAAKAFGSLPERWQLVLWHLEVEGQKPADIAPLLGMSANSVSALAYRAREGLRQAFLTMHLSDITESECRWVNEHLGAYVRKGLAKRDTAKVQAHLDGCRRCTAMYLELTDVNSNLSGIIAPLLLGGAATGYLASTGTTGVAGVLSILSKVKETVTANSGVATAGAVAAGVAAIAVIGLALTQGGGDRVADAHGPPAASTPAAPAPSLPAGDDTTGEPRKVVSERPSSGASPSVATTSQATSLPAFLPTIEPSVTPSDAPAGLPGILGTASPSSAPTDAPTDAPALDQETSLAFSQAPVVTDGHLLLSLSGDPIPPEVTVSLEGDLGGITFAGGTWGTCTAAGTTAVCTPTLEFASAGAARLAAAVSAVPGLTADLPLSIPDVYAGRTFAVVVTVPDGYTVGGQRSIQQPATYVPVRDYDFTVGALQADGDDSDATFPLSTRVGGVPSVVQELVLDVTVDDGTTVEEVTGVGAACDWASDTSTVTCTQLPGPDGSFTVDLTVTLADTAAHQVEVGLRVPDGWTDPVTEDNVRQITLDPVDPLLEVDAKVDGSSKPTGESGKGTVSAHVTVEPSVPVTLVVRYDRDVVRLTTDAACVTSSAGLNCVLSPMEGSATASFDYVFVDREGNQARQATITFTVSADPEAYREATPGDNSDDVTLTRDPGDTRAASSTRTPTGTAKGAQAVGGLTASAHGPSASVHGPTASVHGPVDRDRRAAGDGGAGRDRRADSGGHSAQRDGRAHRDGRSRFDTRSTGSPLSRVFP